MQDFVSGTEVLQERISLAVAYLGRWLFNDRRSVRLMASRLMSELLMSSIRFRTTKRQTEMPTLLARREVATRI